jgi:MFS family permease
LTDSASTSVPAEASGSQRLAVLLAMAMFVLVVDTSLMNVSISAVVTDLGTTVSSVQSAIALEALVSAAFILIGSKVGDLFGRKRAYVLGLLGYAAGAVAMTRAQACRDRDLLDGAGAGSALRCCCRRCSRSGRSWRSAWWAWEGSSGGWCGASARAGRR